VQSLPSGFALKVGFDLKALFLTLKSTIEGGFARRICDLLDIFKAETI